MKVRTLNRAEADAEYRKWIHDQENLPSIPVVWKKTRITIQNFYEEAVKQAGTSSRSDYITDCLFGLSLYKWLNQQDWFSTALAADDDFWRYLCVVIAPDVVFKRWGESPGHYWSNGARIYFRSVWWYVFLSWQNDEETTRTVLLNPNFNSDTVLNLTERPGKNGIYVEVFRSIMCYYSYLSPETASEAALNKKTTLFRMLLKLHTTRITVIDPMLFADGPREYVRSLFLDLKITQEKCPAIFEN